MRGGEHLRHPADSDEAVDTPLATEDSAHPFGRLRVGETAHQFAGAVFHGPKGRHGAGVRGGHSFRHVGGWRHRRVFGDEASATGAVRQVLLEPRDGRRVESSLE